MDEKTEGVRVKSHQAVVQTSFGEANWFYLTSSPIFDFSYMYFLKRLNIRELRVLSFGGKYAYSKSIFGTKERNTSIGKETGLKLTVTQNDLQS